MLRKIRGHLDIKNDRILIRISPSFSSLQSPLSLRRISSSSLLLSSSSPSTSSSSSSSPSTSSSSSSSSSPSSLSRSLLLPQRKISSSSISLSSLSSLSYDEEVISRWSAFKTNTNTPSIINNDDTINRIRTTEMMKGIFSKLVSKTINDELNRVSSLSSLKESLSSLSTIETKLNEYLDNGHIDNAIKLLIDTINTTTNNTNSISENLCNRMLKIVVDECLWTEAAQIASYNIKLGRTLKIDRVIDSTSSASMIDQDEKRILFYIIGGLIKEAKGAAIVLNMISHLIAKHDDSMSLSFHFNKAEKFGSSTGKRYNLWKDERHEWKEIIKEPLRQAMDKSIEAAAAGWYSIPLLKTIIALGCKSENYNLTSHFMVIVVDILDNHYKNGDIRKKEILDLTIAFKEGVCAGIIHNNDIKSFPVLRAPLDLAIKRMKTSGDVGLLKTLEILKLYWVLSYRLREASTQDILLDESTKKCHADLIKLYHDNKRTSDDYGVASGQERRTFRILCDELGFRHKVIEDKSLMSSTSTSVRAWKSNIHTVIPPTLDELLRLDSINIQEYRKFDGIPAYFNELTSILSSVNDKDTVLHICMNLTKSMAAVYPSPQWSFHLLDFLRNSGYKIPRGLLRNVMLMCERRADIYGILEILRIDQEETAKYNSKSTMFTSNTSVTHKSFEQVDWYNACKFALQSRRWKTMPQKSLEEAFTEILGLMQSSGIELDLKSDPHTTKILLQFALEIPSTMNICKRILKKLYRDKTIPINYVECIALTSLIMNSSINNFEDSELLSLTKPLYKSENYLTVNPRSLDKIFKLIIKHNDILGQKFLNDCEAAWKILKNQEGRVMFFDIMMHTVSLKGKRTEIIQKYDDNVRDTVTILGVYAAYLISYYDKDYRKAYDLLYAIQSLNEDAEVQRIL